MLEQTKNTRAHSSSLLIALAAVLMVGCVGNGGRSPAEPTNNDDADYKSAYPDDEMLSLTLDDSATDGALTLTTVEQEITGETAEFREQAAEVVEDLNELLGYAHNEISQIMETSEWSRVEVNNLVCHQWEADGTVAHWRIRSCRISLSARSYALYADGRPLDSASDSDYLPLLAGSVRIFSGQRRGAGTMGYNFDNYATLTGHPVGGTMGVGYHVDAYGRQFVLGMNGVFGPETVNPHIGMFRYAQVIGTGGSFSFITRGDFLTRDIESGAIELGSDGTDELGRIAMGWLTGTGARTAVAACDGTVGDDSCIHMVQCWEVNGLATYEEIAEGSAEPIFSDTECPASYWIPEIPEESDEVIPEATLEETGAPVVDEPEAIEEQ